MNGRLAKIRRLLERYASKQSLFRHLEEHLFRRTDHRYRVIRDAYELAEREFADVRRESGEPYMTHLHAVVVIGVIYAGIRDYRVICALILHDIQEEFWTKWPTYKIAARFGRSIAKIVDECTIIPHLHYFASEEDRAAYYYTRIRRSHAVKPRMRGKMRRVHTGSIRVKLCDRLHNIITLCFIRDRARRLYKTRETKIHLLDLARKYQFLYKELCAALREAENL